MMSVAKTLPVWRITGVAEMIKEHYVVNENGDRVSVILDLEDYRELLEELEELEALRAYDAAKASGGPIIPFEQAIAEIEQERQ
jgi:hypothetical protein